jgi:hypothetical protein
MKAVNNNPKSEEVINASYIEKRKMEKSKVLKKVRELAEAQFVFRDRITINQSEIAVIMQTFNLSWDELKQPLDTFSLYYEEKRTKSDLKKEAQDLVTMIIRAREKDLESPEKELKLMLKGFLNGVRFFNPELSDEIALEVDSA